MSKWIDAKQEDVEFNSAWEESINVYMWSDDEGNNYVTIPVKFILELLENNGYKIEKPNKR